MINLALPPNWQIWQIGELCEPITLVDPRREEEGTFKYIDISSIDNQQKLIIQRIVRLNFEDYFRLRRYVWWRGWLMPIFKHFWAPGTAFDPARGPTPRRAPTKMTRPG